MRRKPPLRRRMLSGVLPEDALTGAARITLSGKTAALIEGQHGVVEMSEKQIRLKSKGGIICIRGRNLKIRELSLDAAVIQGDEIDSVSYE